MLRMLVAVWALMSLMTAAASGGQQRLESPRTLQPAFARAAFAKGDRFPPPPACPAKYDDGLETNGIAPIGDMAGVTPPKAAFTPEAEFSDKARKAIYKKHLLPFLSDTTIEFVVGTDGKPRDLCVRQSGAFDLDREAAKAVLSYQFEPAVKDGRPVTKRTSVGVRFVIR